MNQKLKLEGDGILFLVLILSLLIYSRGMIREGQPVGQICLNNFNNNFFIRVTGDIKEPGTYSFFETVDLNELIRRAGGLKVDCQKYQPSENLDLISGNWVIVKQKEKGCIFTRTEMPAFHKVTLGIPIDINGESIEGLTAIPGIGGSLAVRIAEERVKKNGFRDLNEIRDIPGIGNRLYAKIAPYITLK